MAVSVASKFLTHTRNAVKTAAELSGALRAPHSSVEHKRPPCTDDVIRAFRIETLESEAPSHDHALKTARDFLFLRRSIDHFEEVVKKEGLFPDPVAEVDRVQRTGRLVGLEYKQPEVLPGQKDGKSAEGNYVSYKPADL